MNANQIAMTAVSVELGDGEAPVTITLKTVDVPRFSEFFARAVGPFPRDERAAFEKWVSDNGRRHALEQSFGDYSNDISRVQWRAWRARAELDGARGVQEAPHG
jgi:hypothetical protein